MARAGLRVPPLRLRLSGRRWRTDSICLKCSDRGTAPQLAVCKTVAAPAVYGCSPSSVLKTGSNLAGWLELAPALIGAQVDPAEMVNTVTPELPDLAEAKAKANAAAAAAAAHDGTWLSTTGWC